MIGVLIQRGRGVKFEGVEVGMSGCSKYKLLVTVTEGTTGMVIEVEGEETRGEGNSSGRGNCARWRNKRSGKGMSGGRIGWDVIDGKIVLVMVCGVLVEIC